MAKIFKFDIGLYRGPKPESYVDVQEMADRYGIRTIINMQSSNTNEQVAWSKHAGIFAPIDIKLCPAFPPMQAEVELVLDMLNTDAMKPIYLHCRAGVDRTGFMVAAYRMRYQGWSYEKAHQEMLDMGHNWWLYWWDGYLKKYENK